MALPSRDLLSDPFNSRGRRPSHRVTRRVLVALVAANLGWAPTALAQDDQVKACAEAYEQAQVTRNSGKLKESEEQLRVCVRDVCPDFVKVDCGQWLSDVRREMPSVILMVTDGSGNEVTDVQVLVDGAVLAQKLDGRALEVNPGPHEFTFERQGTKRAERVSIRQGEKNRVIKIELVSRADQDADGVIDAEDQCPAELGPAGNRGCPAPEAPPPASEEASDGLRVGALVAAGVGVLGFGTFAVAGTLSRLNTNKAIDECGETGDICTPSEVKEFQDNEALYNPIANVGVVVGLVGAATAVVLFALSMEEDEPSEARAGIVDFDVAPTSGGAWLSARTRF